MNSSGKTSHETLSLGTQVVTKEPFVGIDGVEIRPSGGVGVVVELPSNVRATYQIRFADGETTTFLRRDLEILSHHKSSALGHDKLPDLFEHVIYRCIVGSRAFGLDEEVSDVDIRGIYLPPADLQWSLASVPGIIERPNADECYWELERFLVLALKANPNILECLYTPRVEMTNSIAEELLSIRRCFLSRFIHKTYNGYVLSQFKKLSKTRKAGGAIKWKHAMHLIRLLLSATAALRTGELCLDVGSARPRLLAIKHGQMTWDDVEAWRRELQKDFDIAITESPLPETPDYHRVNQFLLDARRQMVTDK